MDQSQREFELERANKELESKLVKQDTQRKLAWTAMLAMCVATGVLFLPLLPDDKIETLIPMLDWFYIAQAGVVGAYMGFTTWMSKR